MSAGPRNRKLPVRCLADSGFTLLEMMIVLFIMAVFLGMAALSFQSVNEEEVFEKPAAALQRAAREAMRHASIYEQPEVIVFDKRGFGVRYRTEADAAGQNGGVWEQHTELPADMTILMKHWGQTEWQPAAGQKWQVLASGLCEPLSVRFDRGHSYMEMQFNPLTGGVADKRLVILP